MEEINQIDDPNIISVESLEIRLQQGKMENVLCDFLETILEREINIATVYFLIAIYNQDQDFFWYALYQVLRIKINTAKIAEDLVGRMEDPALRQRIKDTDYKATVAAIEKGDKNTNLVRKQIIPPSIPSPVIISPKKLETPKIQSQKPKAPRRIPIPTPIEKPTSKEEPTKSIQIDAQHGIKENQRRLKDYLDIMLSSHENNEQIAGLLALILSQHSNAFWYTLSQILDTKHPEKRLIQIEEILENIHLYNNKTLIDDAPLIKNIQARSPKLQVTFLYVGVKKERRTPNPPEVKASLQDILSEINIEQTREKNEEILRTYLDTTSPSEHNEEIIAALLSLLYTQEHTIFVDYLRTTLKWKSAKKRLETILRLLRKHQDQKTPPFIPVKTAPAAKEASWNDKEDIPRPVYKPLPPRMISTTIVPSSKPLRAAASLSQNKDTVSIAEEKQNEICKLAKRLENKEDVDEVLNIIHDYLNEVIPNLENRNLALYLGRIFKDFQEFFWYSVHHVLSQPRDQQRVEKADEILSLLEDEETPQQLDMAQKARMSFHRQIREIEQKAGISL